ncbi:MAG TPA: substrate-binding domain-containing protein [Burkholderiales bacterium]|jgi:tungstate transport system substrate-binding protein|nr:substrate-binding domain-containing protein [Burkholderiales bacterium]
MTASSRIPGFVLLLLTGIAAAQAAPELRLATTTSTENSGLLNAILPLFEAKYDTKVRVISVGSGKAMKLGENGDVDVVLVHSRADEEKFVAAGFGVNRHDVMYNDFVIVGPKSDPAGIRGSDVFEAFEKIAATGGRFVSRGDDSGTHKMEQSYWKAVGVEPAAMSAYISAGLGMGEVLMMTAEMRCYTLTDRATYTAYRVKTGLEILVSGDPKLFNPYGVIAVNPVRHPGVNHAGAMQFIEWLTSSDGQAAIAAFRVDGEQLFFPSAH